MQMVSRYCPGSAREHRPNPKSIPTSKRRSGSISGGLMECSVATNRRRQDRQWSHQGQLPLRRDRRQTDCPQTDRLWKKINRIRARSSEARCHWRAATCGTERDRPRIVTQRARGTHGYGSYARGARLHGQRSQVVHGPARG